MSIFNQIFDPSPEDIERQHYESEDAQANYEMVRARGLETVRAAIEEQYLNPVHRHPKNCDTLREIQMELSVPYDTAKLAKANEVKPEEARAMLDDTFATAISIHLAAKPMGHRNTACVGYYSPDPDLEKTDIPLLTKTLVRNLTNPPQHHGSIGFGLSGSSRDSGSRDSNANLVNIMGTGGRN